MANTIIVNTVERGNQQFQGVFKEMFTVKCTVTDTNAVPATDSIGVPITVPGVAVGDIVVAHSLNGDPIDGGGDRAILYPVVSAANTVMVNIHTDADQFDANAINDNELKILIGRPNW